MFCSFLPAQWSFDFFDSFSIKTSVVLPTYFDKFSKLCFCWRFMISESLFCFVSSSILSSSFLEARVPGLSEYLNMKPKSYFTSSIKLNVSSWSWAVSFGNPVIISCEKPQSGKISLILEISFKYSSLECCLFIALSITSLPDWTGKWIWLQIFLCFFMVKITSSWKSWGFDVVNLILILGNSLATKSKSFEKFTAVFFWISDAFLKSFFKPPPYHK